MTPAANLRGREFENFCTLVATNAGSAARAAHLSDKLAEMYATPPSYDPANVGFFQDVARYLRLKG